MAYRLPPEGHSTASPPSLVPANGATPRLDINPIGVRVQPVFAPCAAGDNTGSDSPRSLVLANGATSRLDTVNPIGVRVEPVFSSYVPIANPGSASLPVLFPANGEIRRLDVLNRTRAHVRPMPRRRLMMADTPATSTRSSIPANEPPSRLGGNSPIGVRVQPVYRPFELETITDSVPKNNAPSQLDLNNRIGIRVEPVYRSHVASASTVLPGPSGDLFGLGTSNQVLHGIPEAGGGDRVLPQPEKIDASNDFEMQYLKLVDMFPNADTGFLWNECKRRAGNEEALSAFIAELLENNVETLQEKELRYLKLLEMLPDADPEYLSNQCSQIKDDASLQTFINDALTHRSYPKVNSNNIVEGRSARDGTSSQQMIEQQYQKLVELFPDADTGYLWGQCRLRAHDEESMKTFIDRAQKFGTYPKSSDRVQDDHTKLEQQYQNLLQLFPDADPTYLWEQCKTLTYDERGMEDFIRFSKQYQNYPKQPDDLKPKIEMEGVDEGVQDVVNFQYHYLLEMLPNADPSFLLEKCKEFLGDENALQDFISEALENQNYPTIENHVEVQKASMLLKTYIEKFYAEDFLKTFPDPWKYFLEEKLGNKEACPLAKDYLKRRYRNVDREVVDTAYQRNKYRLALTCKELDAAFHDHDDMRWDLLFGVRNLSVPFVQEVAFIEFENRIKEYIEFRKMVRGKAFARAKAAGTLLECACCFNNELLPEDVTSCSSGHLFCVECVTRGAETWIGEGRTRFPCYTGDTCTGEFSLATLQCVLKPSVYSSLLLRKQMVELTEAGLSDIESCPFCDYIAIPPEEDKVFHCLNPVCMKDSCRSCKELSHIPLRCNEVEKPEEIRLRNYIEDKMSEALIRECYRCKKKFIKQDGCNKMTCTCGAKMCYLCRQPIQGYDHFKSGPCPLYSKNDDLHVNDVLREGRRARDTALATNPGVKLKNDPTVVPPK